MISHSAGRHGCRPLRLKLKMKRAVHACPGSEADRVPYEWIKNKDQAQNQPTMIPPPLQARNPG